MTVQPVEQGEAPVGELPRGRRVHWWWLTAGVALMVVAGSGVWWLRATEPVPANQEPSGPMTTTEVIRETISDTRSFRGTLGHGDPLTIQTTSQGVVTRVAEVGTYVERGTELYRIDEQPVTAMFGEIPMYRDLTLGDRGVDVEQLIDNLAAMGYADCEVTDEFTECLQQAVEDWQADLGVEETGHVGQGRIVFLLAGHQISSVHTRLGEVITAGRPVMDLTGTDQKITLTVSVRDRDLFSVGTEVTVQLPGGVEVDGTVTFSQVVANPDAGPGAGIDDTVTRVEVTLADAVDAALLGAPANVVIAIGERVDVLTVPVNALLALSEGGHGLEVVASDGTTIVPVETGLFAGGRVEISATGIEEGTVVGVAGR